MTKELTILRTASNLQFSPNLFLDVVVTGLNFATWKVMVTGIFQRCVVVTRNQLITMMQSIKRLEEKFPGLPIFRRCKEIQWKIVVKVVNTPQKYCVTTVTFNWYVFAIRNKHRRKPVAVGKGKKIVVNQSTEV